MKLRWVTLHVSDMDKSVAFYRDLLGLKIDRQFGNEEHMITFFGEGDDAKVELIYQRGAAIENAGKGVSMGFGVQNLDSVIEELKKHVTAPITGPISPNPGIRFYLVPDPDGYTIQLYE